LEQARVLLKNKNITKAIEDLLHRLAHTEKELDQLKHMQAMQVKKELMQQFELRGDLNVLVAEVNIDNNAMKDICFQLKAEVTNAFILLANVQGGKPTIAVALSDSLVNERKWSAGSLVKEWSKEIKGGGGGQAFFATAGGTDASGISKVFELAFDLTKN